LYFGQKPLVELGVMNQQPFSEAIAYPKEFGDVFSTTQTGNGTIRQPKYTQNIKILKAENGVVYAQDYTTGQPRRYQWLAGTAYNCWAQAQVTVGDQVIDVTMQLDKVQFMFQGNDFRGFTKTEESDL
jgi:hypothetical protein